MGYSSIFDSTTIDMFTIALTDYGLFRLIDLDVVG
jgi:hypothetical protein